MPELWHCCVYLSLVRIKMRFPDAWNMSGFIYNPPFFCHGQLYVGLSRATSSCNVHVLLPETPAGLNRKTANVVYPEVLIDWNYCNTNICGANADRYTHNVLCSIDIILISYETLHSNHYIIDSENLTGRKWLPGLSMTRESQYKSESNNIGAIRFSRNRKWFLPSSHNFGKTFE